MFVPVDKAKVKSAANALTYIQLSIAFVITASYLFGCAPKDLFGTPLASTYLTLVQNVGEISIKRSGENFRIFTRTGPKNGTLIMRESLTLDTERALDQFFSKTGDLTLEHVREVIDLSKPAGSTE